MNQQTTVLIIGAGPTGLMMAAQLARFDVDFIIIEQHTEPSEKTKAIAVQARTMEIYDQMGLKDKVLSQSLRFGNTRIIGKTHIKVSIPIGDIGKGQSPFPYVSIFTQDRNEKLLNEYLADHDKKVQWATSFKGLEETEEGIIVKVENAEGNKGSIKAKYVIAADGGRSPVRHFLNMSFEGDTYEQVFFVADTAVEWKYGYGDLFLCFAKNKLAAFFPMPGEKRFRVISIIPESLLKKKDITFDDIKPLFPKDMDIDVRFYDTSWFSEYRIHHRVINRFSKGNVFFAGDAAHIHSPAGGQGMNTGLQDAYNLAWKIAFVNKYGCNTKLLETYNEERLPNAIELVKTTDRGFTTVVNANPFFRANILPVLAKIAVRIPFIRKQIFRRVSQIAITYEQFSLSHGSTPKHKAGQRLPFTEIVQEGKNVNVYSLLTATVFHVLICISHAMPPVQLQSIIQQIENIKHGLFKAVVIDQNQSAAFKAWGIKQNTLIAVRPDNYTGCITNSMNVEEVKKWYEKYIQSN